MTGTAPHSALRDLRTRLGTPPALAVLAGMAVIFGISGPFGTQAELGLLSRLGYWAAVVGLTAMVGFLVSSRVNPRLQARPPVVRIAVAGLAVACAVSVVLALINLPFGQHGETPAEVVQGFCAVLVICLVIETIAEVAARHSTAAIAALPPAVGLPPVLHRLPLEKRGRLVSLSVEDHYVTVVTDRGRAMILMRLGDAIREAAPVPGLRVHRAHWVALDQIATARRDGDGAILTLRDGRAVPVSRSAVAAVRDAGLLPRRGTGA